MDGKSVVKKSDCIEERSVGMAAWLVERPWERRWQQSPMASQTQHVSRRRTYRHRVVQHRPRGRVRRRSTYLRISINPTNQHVFISGARDAFAKLWNIQTGKAIQTSQATNPTSMLCNSSLMARLLILFLSWRYVVGEPGGTSEHLSERVSMQKFCSCRESSAPMPKTQALPVKRDTEEVMHENSPAARQGHPTCCVGDFSRQCEERLEKASASRACSSSPERIYALPAPKGLGLKIIGCTWHAFCWNSYQRFGHTKYRSLP